MSGGKTLRNISVQICKNERSSSGGSSKENTASNWHFYREMSFMNLHETILHIKKVRLNTVRDIILCYIRLKRKLVVMKKYYAYRRTSNVEEVEEDPEAGVISVDDDANANVAHDEEVARAVALDEHMASNTPVVTSAVTAAVPSTSTSTTSSFRVKLNIHLQDTMPKVQGQLLHLEGGKR